MSQVPQLNLSSVGAKSIVTPNIPGMRYNGYVKSARGTGRVDVFDFKYGYCTEGRSQTARSAKLSAVS
jgi:hypothetical protein